MDYKNSKIYKLQCDDGQYYIGSTASTLTKRLCGHKKDSKRQPERRVYTHINELGWNRVRIVLIEDCPCESKEQLTRKEDEHIRRCREDPLCLNTNCAFRTPEQIVEGNKERGKQHYEANIDHRLKYQMEYNQTNKVRIAERRKKAYQNKKSNQ